MNAPITLRVACPADAQALVEIYAPYVRDTAITFEYTVPTVEEFAQRIAQPPVSSTHLAVYKRQPQWNGSMERVASWSRFHGGPARVARVFRRGRATE